MKDMPDILLRLSERIRSYRGLYDEEIPDVAWNELYVLVKDAYLVMDIIDGLDRKEWPKFEGEWPACEET